MPTALVIVDVQNDFCEGGSLAVAGGAAVARRISAHLASHGYDAVCATKDFHVEPGDHFAATGTAPNFSTSWPVHCVAGEKGSEFHPDLDTGPIEAVFVKGEHAAAYSGFEGHLQGGSAGLTAWLHERGITDVDVCGIATDFCVRATAADAAEAGFRTTVLLDLCAAVAPESEAQAIDALASDGVTIRR